MGSGRDPASPLPYIPPSTRASLAHFPYIISITTSYYHRTSLLSPRHTGEDGSPLLWASLAQNPHTVSHISGAEQRTYREGNIALGMIVHVTYVR